MGAWGPGLFSDDTARDVRDEYRELVGDGRSGPEVTDALVATWGASIADPDVGPVFWLALADTQWRAGGLEPRVKNEALRIIADGSDLAHWTDDPKALERRRNVLAELKNRLELLPQPPAKRFRKVFKNTCEWEIGELIGYRLRSGRHVALRVIGHHSDRGGTSPVCELLDWTGNAVPVASDMERIGVRKGTTRHVLGKNALLSQFLIGRLRESDLPAERVFRLGTKLPPSQLAHDYLIQLWRSFDEFLEREFGLS